LEFRLGEAIQLNNLGLIYREKGDLEEAQKNLETALELFKTEGDKQGEAAVLGSLALVYSDKGDYENTMKCLRDAAKFQSDKRVLEKNQKKKK
ncbi:MAG: tetratricopeptide repeat protein, partial [Thermoplasmata archaeon]|nr:tetratricopeptide repeat protein [Thermoplasmata archaeon]